MAKKDFSPKEKLNLMKSWALKSGYPLENDIANILTKLESAKIERGVRFYARNEMGETVIRSIDFKCTFKISSKNIPHSSWRRAPDESANLVFLIDAKFSEDETFWFTPADNPATSTPLLFPHLIPMLTKDFGRDNVKIHHKEYVEVAQVPQHLPTALSGKKVKEQSKERNSLDDYQAQMIGALQSVVAEESGLLGKVVSDIHSDYNRDAHIYIPVIVTNAPQLLLNRNISTQGVADAKIEEEISKPCNVLVVTQPNLAHLRAELAELSNTMLRIRTANLAWVPQDMTTFPILFSNISSLEAVMREFFDKFKCAIEI